ncbi:Rep family protein [Staphylococcus cohnii]|uniref:Rep family protein n=1 Tax=Staphylococcus cohnii TaxID=29382 RepID=UPI001BB42C92|nr:Rep family protein [Staphylococcus cohnii]
MASFEAKKSLALFRPLILLLFLGVGLVIHPEKISAISANFINIITEVIFMSNVKAKNIMFVQELEYLEGNNIQEYIENITMKLNPIKFAGIIHDKDIDDNGHIVDSHLHLVLQFKNARSLNSLAKLTNQKTQYFEQWKGNVNNAYSYLIHHTRAAQDLHQYDVKEVIANFNFAELMAKISNDVEVKSKVRDSVVINNLLDLLYDGLISIEEVESTLSGSQYAKAKSKIEAVYTKRLEYIATNWRAEMREKNEPFSIFWLFGDAGTGKTRIAKIYAKQFSDEYFITGSSRDPFQRYKLQPVVILDEMRPHQFDYSDLLKMLDPYNDEAMAGSRYFDKPLTANVYIITSPYSPENFFAEVCKQKNMNPTVDTLHQLIRRITFVQEITKSETCLFFYDENQAKYLKDPSTIQSNPISKTFLPKQKNKNLAVKTYNELLDSIKNI